MCLHLVTDKTSNKQKEHYCQQTTPCRDLMLFKLIQLHLPITQHTHTLLGSTWYAHSSVKMSNILPHKFWCNSIPMYITKTAGAVSIMSPSNLEFFSCLQHAHFDQFHVSRNQAPFVLLLFHFSGNNTKISNTKLSSAVLFLLTHLLDIICRAEHNSNINVYPHNVTNNDSINWRSAHY